MIVHNYGGLTMFKFVYVKVVLIGLPDLPLTLKLDIKASVKTLIFIQLCVNAAIFNVSENL